MRFYTPCQLAKLTPRSRRFWCNLARAGDLPGAVFFSKTASTSKRQIAGIVRGEWWIPETGLLAWVKKHGEMVGMLIETDEFHAITARSEGELRRKVAA